MPIPRHYSQAPITEAVIDIRVAPRAQLTLAEVESIGGGEAERYPDRQGTFLAAGPFDPGAAAADRSGSRFASADRKLIWQSRRDGFTFSRLAPYDRWEPFREESQRLWLLCRGLTRPESVTRIAVRYINRFDIPAVSFNLKRYFLTAPDLAPSLPQRLAGFFLQVQVPQDDIGGYALINQARIPSARTGIVSIVLDIDLCCNQNLPQEEPVLWQRFEALHERMNEIFEACITDEARKLIE